MPDEPLPLLELEGFLHYHVRVEVLYVGLLGRELELCLERLVLALGVLFLWQTLDDQVALYPLPLAINYILHCA